MNIGTGEQHMNSPPRHFVQPLEGHGESELAGLAVARSTREIERIAAVIDQHRGTEAGGELVEDHDAKRNAFMARRLLEISHQVDSVFEGPLLANPGWDILLDLFIQRSEGKRISIISVCIAANAPTSTVLRYLQAMMDVGTIIRSRSVEDSQGLLISLSDEAYAKMKAILA
jgi:hypothetical protein